MSNNDTGTSVLQSLGMLHIWTFIILGPVMVIALGALAVFIWNSQKGWKSTIASCVGGNHDRGSSTARPAVRCCASGGSNFACNVTLADDNSTPKKQYRLVLPDDGNPNVDHWDVV